MWGGGALGMTVGEGNRVTIRDCVYGEVGSGFLSSQEQGMELLVARAAVLR